MASQASLEHRHVVDTIVAGDANEAMRIAHQHLTERSDLAYPFSLEAVVVAETVRDRQN